MGWGWRWRDDSSGQRTDYAYRGPGFCSQHSSGSSKPPVPPGPGDPMLTSDLWGLYMHIHIFWYHTHKKGKNFNELHIKLVYNPGILN